MTADTAITLQCTKLWKVYGVDGEARLGERPLPEGQEAMSLAGELESEGNIVACGNINLKISRGEFFVLMGLSGSGKSTLMRNGIENFWNQAKRHLRKYNGSPQHHFNLFLKECEWRFNTQSPEKMRKELKGWLKEGNT